MLRPLTRIAPAGRVEAYKTYQIVAPRSTHWRPATCAEVECAGHTRGWVTIVPADGAQAVYIRTQSGRKFTENTADGMATFAFPAGQSCFRSRDHMVPLEREPLYIVRGGDWRGNPFGDRRQHARAADWVEDFAEHQSALADQIEEG